MRGRVKAKSLAEVADAAVAVFTSKGFGPGGISDVAAALGRSHGALYTYVDSKQALLYLALLRVIRPDAVNDLAIPVTAPPPRDVVAMVDAWAGDQTGFKVLAEVGGAPTRPVAEEFAAIVEELYDFIDRNRRILALFARCSEELPELAQWYFVERRRATFQHLTDYLRDRIAAGHVKPVPDLPVAARFIVETIAWFAMHRHGDPDSTAFDDEASRRTVRHLLLAAFLPDTSGSAPG